MRQIVLSILTAIVVLTAAAQAFAGSETGNGCRGNEGGNGVRVIVAGDGGGNG
jgi:hypothetical protein